MAIDPYRTGPQPLGHFVRQAAIACPHARGETVDRVVGLLGDAVEIAVIEGLDHKDGTEDLLAHDLHVRLRVGDHGWRHEIAAAVATLGAAGLDLGALLLAGLDVAGHARELLLRDQRSHLSCGIEPRAQLDRLGYFADPLDHLVEHLLVREEARAGAAGLAPG